MRPPFQSVFPIFQISSIFFPSYSRVIQPTPHPKIRFITQIFVMHDTPVPKWRAGIHIFIWNCNIFCQVLSHTGRKRRRREKFFKSIRSCKSKMVLDPVAIPWSDTSIQEHGDRIGMHEGEGRTIPNHFWKFTFLANFYIFDQIINFCKIFSSLTPNLSTDLPMGHNHNEAKHNSAAASVRLRAK